MNLWPVEHKSYKIHILATVVYWNNCIRHQMVLQICFFIWVSGGQACPCGGLRRIPPSLWLSTATSSDIFITIFHNPIQLMCHFGKSVNHAHCATQSKCKRGHAHQNMVGPIEISQRPTAVPLLEIDFWIFGQVCSFFCPDQAEGTKKQYRLRGATKNQP